MNALVESITKPFIVEQSEIKKFIAIYPGRFQPFGAHHKKVYEFLKKKFDDVYIATSDKQQLPRHPLNFKEKVIHMSKMGIPKNKVVKETSPYIPKNILKKFDSDTTAVVFAVGKKDASRLSGGKYFQDYKKSKNNMTGFEEHGYVLIAPHISVSAGGMEVSGTSMRELLGSPKYEKGREKIFKKIFGYFNKNIFNLMVDRFSQIYENNFNAKDVVIYSPTKRQKKNKKWFDGEGQELLYDLEEESGWPLGSGSTIGHGYPSKEDLKKWKKKTNKARSQTDSNKKYHFDPINESKVHRSAGIITYIRENDELKFLLLKSNAGWGFPKGHLEEGETEIAAAKRETKEETGLNIIKIHPSFKYTSKYFMKKDYEINKKLETPELKFVTYFLGEAPSKSVRLSSEHSAYDWFTVSKTKRKLRFSDSKKMLKTAISVLQEEKIEEDINLPVNIGDTVLMGRFKNKKVVVKTIDWNEKGDLLINGRSAMKMRLVKQVNIFDNDITEKQILDFILNTNLSKIIKEASSATASGIHAVDDGPRYWWGNQKSYRISTDKQARKLGFRVVNFILGDEELPEYNTDYPDGPTGSVTYFPAGVVGAQAGTNIEADVKGRTAYRKWLKFIKKIALTAGYKFVDFLDAEKSIESSKDEPIEKGDPGDIVPPETELKDEKDQHKDYEEVKEQILTKEWWKSIITEDWWKEVKEDIKPDIIKSFTMQNSLNSKLWDGHTLKPEIKEKLLIIANNFFKDLELDVKLHDITLTGSISNYNWSKFSDVDLHLRIKFSEVDENTDLVNNYVLSKKNEWNEKHDITIFGFPVEVYVENVGESHVASGLYSILNDKWIVEPKKKELQIDLDDIRTKAEGYLSYTAFLEKYMKSKEYDKVITAIDKIKEKLKRMRSSGLARGGEFSVENLAFKALRRSPFIADITKMKTDAYDNKMTMEEHTFTKEWWKKLLLEGGAYGHMSHPFDDWGLTFSDLKKIIELGLSGNLHREDNVTEKLDGQNLMVSWKNGKLIAARNKGHLKNAGKTAVDIKGMISMFKGRGEIYNAFVFAVKDLQKAISSLSKKQQDKIFMNGKAFMNLEVMWPKSANVVNYDLTQLVFHGAIEYNDAGTPVGEVKGSARILEGMIRQVNQHVQKHYKIGKPQFLTVPKNQDFAVRKTYYFKKLQKLQNQYAMRDADTFGLYHQRFWEEFINNAAKQMRYSISNKILQNLVKRWAFHDKSYKISQIKNDVKDDKFLDWVLSFDKNDHVKFVKSNMKPFELLFFELGAEILKNISGFLAVNPDKSVQAMKKQVDKAVSNIRAGGNIEKIQKLKTQLEKLNSIGGMNAIVPSEGLVFKYGGKTYKFTGAFAPVNQIIGMLKFSR